MSRFRLSAKVRTNAGYQALTRWLDDNGFKHRVVQPNNKGHPALEITAPDGAQMLHTIACTPMGGENTKARIAQLKRDLAAKDMLPPLTVR